MTARRASNSMNWQYSLVGGEGSISQDLSFDDLAAPNEEHISKASPLRSLSTPAEGHTSTSLSRSSTVPSTTPSHPIQSKATHSDLRPFRLPALIHEHVPPSQSANEPVSGPDSQTLRPLSLIHWDSDKTVITDPTLSSTVTPAAPNTDTQSVDPFVQVVDSPSIIRHRSSVVASAHTGGRFSGARQNSAGAPSKPRRVMIWLDQKYEKSLRFLKKHWTLVILLFLATVVSCSIGIGWALRLHTFDGVNPFDFTLNANVFLSANLVDIDPQKQVMTLEWAIDGYQVGTMSNGSVIWCEEVDSCPDVAIYFDVNLLQTSSSSPGTIASNTKPDPIFILNGTNWQTYFQGTDYRPSSPYFRTDVAITDAGTRRTAQSYPFDKYTATLAIFAEAIPGNDTIGLYVERTTGIAVGFNAKLLDSGLASDNKTFVKNIEVTRGPVIRVYAIFIVMAIWVVTLTFLVAGVAVIFFGKGVRAEVLTLPVATLFAFTQLRSTLPGAPDGFGADIDFVGILPCLALLTVCSVFMTAIFLFRNPEVNTSTYNVMFSDPSEPPSDEKRPLVQ